MTAVLSDGYAAEAIDALVAMATGLTAALSASDRHQRLLEAIGRVIPYDAAALLRLEGEDFVPVAARGLAAGVIDLRFRRRDHPRLDIIARSTAPVRFPPGSPLPDPFDGLLSSGASAGHRVHACLGCPLSVAGELVGALTADALEPTAFDHLEDRFVAAVGALAGAELRTTCLIEALERSAARKELIARDLMRDTQIRQGGQFLGVSPAMDRLREEIAIVARSDLPVLVTGETGVGKELVARAIHALSDRREEPLIYVNCAALPESLAESELFGHRKGAFTGASSDRAGKFEVADGGTLFLDEIGELPLTIQPKLLRALQAGEIQRVGSDRSLHVNVRVLAATNRELASEIEGGRFRADLFHRLNVYPLHVPPLRERPEDIPVLAAHFCDLSRRRLGLGPVRLSDDGVSALGQLAWPGNVRELENVISRSVLRAAASRPPATPIVVGSSHLGLEHGPSSLRPSDSTIEPAPPELPGSLREATEQLQRELIARALALAGGSWAGAARALGLHRSNLHRLAVRLGVRPGRDER